MPAVPPILYKTANPGGLVVYRPEQVLPKSPYRERRWNEWILEETWRIVDTQVAV